jgi:hypothetical protein
MEPSNRRISLIVQYMVKPGEEDAGRAVAGAVPAAPGTTSSAGTTPPDILPAKTAAPPH